MTSDSAGRFESSNGDEEELNHAQYAVASLQEFTSQLAQLTHIVHDCPPSGFLAPKPA